MGPLFVSPQNKSPTALGSRLKLLILGNSHVYGVYLENHMKPKIGAIYRIL